MSVLTQRHPGLESLSDDLIRTGKWQHWSANDARLAGLNSLEQALENWRHDHGEASYLTVSALAACGSRRGDDDPEAALAVVVLLQDAIVALACELATGSLASSPLDDVVDDVMCAVWEEVRRSAPNLAHRGPRILLQRALGRATEVDRRCRVPRARFVSWEAMLDRAEAGTSDLEQADLVRGLIDAATGSAHGGGAGEDLADLLTWARGHGVLRASEVDLVVELIAAQRAGASEAAHRMLSDRHGVTVRAIRRRRAAAVDRLRAAAPQYLAAVS
ncbi:MAG: hypothetical protein ABIR82_03685 [Nocardioides sp.]